MRHKVRHSYIIHLQELPQAVAFMENRKQRGSHQGQGSGWRGKQEPASEGPRSRQGSGRHPPLALIGKQEQSKHTQALPLAHSQAQSLHRCPQGASPMQNPHPGVLPRPHTPVTYIRAEGHRL